MKNWIRSLLILAAWLTVLAVIVLWFQKYTKTQNPIKVGIIHSLTGTMGSSETPVEEATLMAINEINENGGLLGGRPILPIIIDIKSDWNFAAKEVKKLIVDEHVKAIFGCWTSACRKTIKPIIEENDSLLFYPLQYEGLEQSPNIVYTGAAPNQQIIPAVKWAYDHLGKNIFLVGSDYVFPRTANAIIKDQVKGLGGEIVGEEYIILGSQVVEEIIDKIVKAKPDFILNTINGDSNIAFFKTLREKGVTSKTIPTISFSIGEGELKSLIRAKCKGILPPGATFKAFPLKKI